jgi:RecA/RadA recombinase
MSDQIETYSEGTLNRRDLLSTGSTLLNLACTGLPYGGFFKGFYYWLVGDSASGKTFLSMTCLAEASIDPRFKDYRFIYDNSEDGCLMNLDNLFGEKMADRLEPPREDKGKPVFSDTIESFYYHLDDAIKDGRPFIYIIDSIDSLTSEAEEKKFQQQKKADRKVKGDDDDDEPVAGSYTDGKAKKHSSNLRGVMHKLKKNGSILIIVSQTRDDFNSRFRSSTTSGGRALRFYATLLIWSSIVRDIKKPVNGRDRSVGTRVALQVKKNRITGRLARVEVDIYPNHGFDDIGTCVDYLVDEDWWSQSGNTITANGLNISGTKEKLIRLIEKKGLEAKLREQCGECWASIEAAMCVKRKNRYAEADQG